MSTNNEGENIFNFEKIDFINLQSTSKPKTKGVFSPTSSPFVNNKSNQENSNKSKKKLNIKKYLKIITANILLIYLIIYFNFDDILPYQINQDSNYKAILEEIPNGNNEILQFIEFGITKTFLSRNIINKYNSYTELCIHDKLLDNNKYPLILNPKISVIMPIYKGGKYLYYSLRSIQNQKMKDIEIILIDDNSPDETLEIVDKYMKEDARIRLIKNEVNRKVLYSKSIGALNARGKYIIQLDQDDMFIRDDVFDILYNEAENNKLDLVQIRDITKNNFHFNKKTIVNCCGKHYIYPKNTQYKEQPELKETLFLNNNIFLLWGLLIKADIYKKAIYELWDIIINYQIIFHEDYMITFMIVILSKNYKYLNKFALIHLNHRNSASSNHWNIKEYYLSILFFTNNLYDYHIKKNPQDYKLAINFMKLTKGGLIRGRELYPNLYNLFIDKISKNIYLLNEDKEFLEQNFMTKKNRNSILDSIEYLSMENFRNLNLKIANKTIIEIQKEEKMKNNINISIIIICDEFKYLEQTINSIENQINFTDYEILLIYDNDDIYNLNEIQKFINLFSNIKLVENHEKKGYLFSISKGILSSNGKYILVMEPGYSLAKNNTLIEIYFQAIKNDVDILEFDLLINNKNFTINNLYQYKCQHFHTKIEKDINNLKFNKNIRDIDLEKDLLFNKLIKSDLFKNLIKKNKLIENENKVYHYYDDIIIFLLQKNFSSVKHINNFGVIKESNQIDYIWKNKIKNNETQKIKDSIFYINFLFENSNDNTGGKENVLIIFNNILSNIFNKFIKTSKESQLLYEKFLNCKYISQLNKNLLKLYYYSLLNK